MDEDVFKLTEIIWN